jgi:hypothetical protein
MLLLLLIAAIWQAWWVAAPDQGDRRALVEYGMLTIALSALTMLRVPGVPARGP